MKKSDRKKRPVIHTEPKIIVRKVDITLDFQDKSLNEILDYINQKIEQYGDNAKVIYEAYGYDGAFDIKISYPSMETEEETQIRIKSEEKKQKAFDKKEQAEYEKFLKLKEKHEGTEK